MNSPGGLCLRMLKALKAPESKQNPRKSVKSVDKKPQKQRIFLKKSVTNDAAACPAYCRTRVICPEGKFMAKNSVNQCLELAWLKTKSKQMKILKRRDQQRLSEGSIFQIQRPFPDRQAFSACSAVSAVKYYVKSGIYRLSNHYAYFTKQTQSSPFLAQNRGFCPKTKPKQTQSNPIKPKLGQFITIISTK
jgi:hypothetical protein